MPKGPSLSERLAALTDPQPAVVDKEVEDEDTLTGARVVEGDEDDDDQGIENILGRSKLRAAADGLLEGDARYRGKKGSRRTLDQDLEEEPMDEDMKEHMAAELGHMFGAGGEEDGDEDSDEGEEGEEEEDDDEEEDTEGGNESGDDQSDEDEGEEENIMVDNEKVNKKSLTKSSPGEFSFDPTASFDQFGDEMDENSDEEEDDEEYEKLEKEESEDEEDDSMEEEGPVKPGALMREKESVDKVKASAVVEQLATWDSLLEQRILLQKMLTRASTFPRRLDSFLEGNGHEKEVKGAGQAMEKVVRSSGEVSGLLPGGVGDILQAGDCDSISRWLGAKHRKLEAGRRAGVSKWEVKTSKIGGFNSLHTPALTQVDQVMAVPGRVVGRTRVKRSEYRVLGGDPVQEEMEGGEDPEVFDDSDFYHTLLRDLIDRKTGGGGAEGDESRQWLKVQRLRSKMKKKVDTRASKGRKVRYDIHSKLVNFMAPVPPVNQWQDSAKNELFSSLFGVRRVPTNAA